jgi:adenosylmethionine-8-amino-7-oxononanoate aminotransferase
MVGEVRAGLGLLAGIDLAPDVLAADPAGPAAWQRACRDSGVLVRPIGKGIAISPPLTCAEADLEVIAERIARGLDQVAGARAGAAA